VSGTTANDPELPDRIAAFLQGLQQLGWTDGRNIRIDIREGGGNPDTIRKYAAELAALAPDVIFTAGTLGLPQLLQATHTVPIVFAIVRARRPDASDRPARALLAATPPRRRAK
jgi:ABC-type uncharacterized transport system substrate-binding protein